MQIFILSGLGLHTLLILGGCVEVDIILAVIAAPATIQRLFLLSQLFLLLQDLGKFRVGARKSGQSYLIVSHVGWYRILQSLIFEDKLL